MFSSSYKAVLQDGRAPKETEPGEVNCVARSSRAETGLPSLPAALLFVQAQNFGSSSLYNKISPYKPTNSFDA